MALQGLMNQRNGNKGQSFLWSSLGAGAGSEVGVPGYIGRIWFLLLESRSEGNCRTEIWPRDSIKTETETWCSRRDREGIVFSDPNR